MNKTAKEIIIQAKHLSQTDNSKAFDWDLLTSLLNNSYTTLYNDLTGYSNSFIGYFDFTDKEVGLPADCNKVLSVFYGTEDNPYFISQSSQNNFIPGNYYIENNTIKVVGKKDSRKITVKYSKLPVTLTAPDDDYLVGDFADAVSFGLCSDEGFYYKTTEPNKYQFYNFDNKETEEFEGTMPARITTFLDRTISIENNKVMWGEDDVTEYFMRDEYDEVANISNAISDNTHIAILYTDGTIWSMMSDFSKTQLNPVLYKGRLYKVDALLGICADDSTGQYILVRKNNKVYKISFVPDTIIDYPDNVFFDIIEDKLSIQLQALQGLDNTALNTKLQQDEMSFYQSLQRSQQGMRIRNVDNRYRWRQM
jgi:hypothetical protein